MENRLYQYFKSRIACLNSLLRLIGIRKFTIFFYSFFLFQSTRVTLKMDVSFADHSHIIGKGGNTIKKGKGKEFLERNTPCTQDRWWR